MRKPALTTLFLAFVLSLLSHPCMAAYAENTVGQVEASSNGIESANTTGDEIEPSAGANIPVLDVIVSQDNAADETIREQPLAAMVETEDASTRMTVQNIPYIDANGIQQTCPEATVVTADENEWTNGWYIALNSVSVDERIVVSGSVNLILANGCTLNANKGITVSAGNSFTVYAQSTDKEQAGSLNATGSWGAGIGGYAIEQGDTRCDCGTVTINGGNVSAQGSSGCAGIGGAGWGNAYFTTYGNCGTVTINGGWVTAKGAGKSLKATAAAAIGNSGGGSGGTIRITGGTVTVEPSGVLAAGIGGGADGYVGTIVVSGGHIIANVNTSASSSNHNPCIGKTMSLSTGPNGTAFIETNDPDFTGNNWGFTSGIILNDGNYYIQGNQVLDGDAVIATDKVLQLYSSATLTIPTGVTLTNNNIIKSNANTTLVVDGCLVNNGAIENNGGLIKGTGTFEGENKPVASKPPAPTVEAVSSTSVTLKAMSDVGYGPVEYARTAGGGTPVPWQSSPVFDSLQPNTEYTFYVRYCGNDFYEESSWSGTVVRTPTPRPGVVSNVTVAENNYLGANFVMPGDYVADAILPAYALQQIANGKDVDLWLESTRGVDDDDTALIKAQLGDYLPITSFKLTSYWQVDGEAPVEGAAQTRDDAMVQISLALPDSAVNADPSIMRTYKVICVYDGKAQVIPATFDPSDNTLRFRTNRLASFGLACKDTRDGKTVYPVMVRNSYAQQSGQGQYAAGEKVTVYSGEREGYMVDFWRASPEDKVTFTYEGADRAEFVMPDSPVVVTPTWIKLGEVKDVTDVSGNALHAQLIDKGAALASKVLSEEAMGLVKGGMEASIWLESSDGVADVDATAIAGALEDWTLAEKIDLTLFYEVDGKTVQVHETNEPLVVSLTLPDSITGDISSKARSYEVIRVHDGKVSVVPSSFDADAKTLTFETDRFSAYAVAYKDAVEGDDTQGDGVNSDDVTKPGSSGIGDDPVGSEGGLGGDSSAEGEHGDKCPQSGGSVETGDECLWLIAALGLFIVLMLAALALTRHKRSLRD